MIDFEERLHAGNSTCIAAFAAGTQHVFQFGRLLSALQLPHVLFRDSATRWYQHGIKGIGDRQAVADYLRDLARRYRVKTAGVSSGAYAALLYGQLAGVEEIIAISPVTTGTATDDIDPKWHHRVAPAPHDPFTIDDLLPLFKGGCTSNIKAFVSDGPGTELDIHMARRLGVEPTLIPGYSHADLARNMRDTGLLATLLR
jgi:hypothetical protein